MLLREDRYGISGSEYLDSFVDFSGICSGMHHRSASDIGILLCRLWEQEHSVEDTVMHRGSFNPDGADDLFMVSSCLFADGCDKATVQEIYF